MVDNFSYSLLVHLLNHFLSSFYQLETHFINQDTSEFDGNDPFVVFHESLDLARKD